MSLILRLFIAKIYLADNANYLALTMLCVRFLRLYFEISVSSFIVHEVKLSHYTEGKRVSFFTIMQQISSESRSLTIETNFIWLRFPEAWQLATI